MTWLLYIQLSLMMVLQFAIWGAWSPVLAARLFGPLKFSGKQVGWIYGTIYLGCIISPLIAGQIVDRWIATQWFLAGAHLVGAVLLWLAARRRTFRGLFLVMLLYALAFAPTLALVQALKFAHLTDPERQALGIDVWGGISWVAVGCLLAAWRRAKGSGDGSDCLKLASALSLLMAVYSLCLPHTPPKSAGDVLPFVEAFSMLRSGDFLVFLVTAFVVATQLQFYFLGTARYLEDIGVPSKTVPAAMAIAQAAQVLALALVAPWVLGRIGFRLTLTAGVACWLVLYLVYALTRPRGLVIASMALHGFAYAFFINVAFIYVNKVAPEGILASALALLTITLFGFGFFLGTQFTGVVMDRFKKDGRFAWRPIYLVPCAVTLLGAVVFAALFHDPVVR